MALIKKRKLNDPALKLQGLPSSNMLITVTDPNTGKTKTVSLVEGVLNSGVSFVGNVAGIAKIDTIPTIEATPQIKLSTLRDAVYFQIFQTEDRQLLPST